MCQVGISSSSPTLNQDVHDVLNDLEQPEQKRVKRDPDQSKHEEKRRSVVSTFAPGLSVSVKKEPTSQPRRASSSTVASLQETLLHSPAGSASADLSQLLSPSHLTPNKDQVAHVRPPSTPLRPPSTPLRPPSTPLRPPNTPLQRPSTPGGGKRPAPTDLGFSGLPPHSPVSTRPPSSMFTSQRPVWSQADVAKFPNSSLIPNSTSSITDPKLPSFIRSTTSPPVLHIPETIFQKSSVVGGVQSSVLGGVQSGVLGGVQSGVFGVQSSVLGGVQSGVQSSVLGGVQSSVLGGVKSGVLGGVQSDVLGNVHSGVLGGVQSGVNINFSGTLSSGVQSSSVGGIQSGVSLNLSTLPTSVQSFGLGGAQSGVKSSIQSKVPIYLQTNPQNNGRLTVLNSEYATKISNVQYSVQSSLHSNTLSNVQSNVLSMQTSPGFGHLKGVGIHGPHPVARPPAQPQRSANMNSSLVEQHATAIQRQELHGQHPGQGAQGYPGVVNPQLGGVLGVQAPLRLVNETQPVPGTSASVVVIEDDQGNKRYINIIRKFSLKKS